MQQERTRRVVLVLGGVRSGKSRYAQELCAQELCLRGDRVTFVATAGRSDDAEMTRKIDRHRAERPEHWTTVEEKLALGDVIRHGHDPVVLIDCLTLFAANLMDAHGDQEEALQARVDDLCAALAETQGMVVLVSNEVGSGVVPAYASGRRFRDLVGEINQRVAAVADEVYLMIAGLPLTLKSLTRQEVSPSP
jgi:adenosylcobinamide kinase/adenosylcobinamide-phosphate guanylyltransferase